jgi:hypothetical protein
MASDPLAALNAPVKPIRQAPQRQAVERKRRSSSEGLLAGVFGCIFGVLGIFTLGLVFVPLAAVCSGIGLLFGLVGRSGSGFGVSLIGCLLTATGAALSPSVWVLLGGLFVASQVQPPPVARNVVSNVAAAPSAATRPLDEAAREAQSAADECRAKRLRGELKTFEEAARCAGDRIMQAYSDANYKHMDLIAKVMASRIALGAKVDRHEVTEAEAQVRFQKILADAQETERLREVGK